MPDLHIRDLTSDEHTTLTQRAREAGVSMNTFALAAIRGAISQPTIFKDTTITLGDKRMVIPAVVWELRAQRRRESRREAARLIASVRTLSERVQALHDRVHGSDES